MHWGYELVESDLFFWSHKNELLLQKAKDRCHDCGGREKAAESYLKWKSQKNKYKNLPEEEKEVKREYQKKILWFKGDK